MLHCDRGNPSPYDKSIHYIRSDRTDIIARRLYHSSGLSMVSLSWFYARLDIPQQCHVFVLPWSNEQWQSISSDMSAGATAQDPGSPFIFHQAFDQASKFHRSTTIGVTIGDHDSDHMNLVDLRPTPTRSPGRSSHSWFISSLSLLTSS